MILKHAVVGVVIALVSIWHQLHPTQARLLNPPSRGTLWKRGYRIPARLEENALYCGGHKHQELIEYGVNFGKGEVTKVFSAGGTAVFEVDPSNIHDDAYIEFKICPSNNSLEHEPQDCFDRHPVNLLDGSGYQFRLHKSNKATVKVKIPGDVNCNFCVLQYHIHEGSGEQHLERVVRPQQSQQDSYGCSDIAIQRDYHHSNGIQGPLIDGIIIKGAANFGNIFGPGSQSSGTANAWSQSIHGSGSYSQSSQNGGGYRGPLIKGLIIEGPGNFGNVYGANSVSSGNANAWSQNVNSQGAIIGSQTVHSAFGQRISGPQLKGISINGQSNFGNIFGPGSRSSGNANAWTQQITYGSVLKGRNRTGPVVSTVHPTRDSTSNPPLGPTVFPVDIIYVDIDIYLKCEIVTTPAPITTLTTPYSGTTPLIPDIPINCTNSSTLNPTLPTRPPFTLPTYRPHTFPSIPTFTYTPPTYVPPTIPSIPTFTYTPPTYVPPTIPSIPTFTYTPPTYVPPTIPSIPTFTYTPPTYVPPTFPSIPTFTYPLPTFTYSPPTFTYPPQPPGPPTILSPGPPSPPVWPHIGPSIHGIAINGSSNFGNIFGQGSISTGNANAWSQRIVNSGSYQGKYGGAYGPSINGISINGAANFGNVFGRGSNSRGNANAWSQEVINSVNGQAQGPPHSVQPLNVGRSNVFAHSFSQTQQLKSGGSAFGAFHASSFGSYGVANKLAQKSRAVYSTSR